MTSHASLPVLPIATWTQRLGDHKQLAQRHTLPARKRRDAGIIHPVEDFLFQYYPFPIALLEKWHPGVGIGLEWDLPEACSPFTGRCYSAKNRVLVADPDLLPAKRRESLTWILHLLIATRNRPPNFACHGLHEWAMVYSGKQVRHESVAGLRLPQAEIDELVESRPIHCSHYDAFRHFAPAARSYNRLNPTIEQRIDFEQPGCIHANMDLYKWAAKAMPWIGTELLLTCFELALELRGLDMRASPYDLSAWGCEPILIENSDGRKFYENEQKHLAIKALAARDTLIHKLQLTLLKQSL